MTALNTFVTTDAAHVFTDGAGYCADGKMGGTYQKVALHAALHAVVAARGLSTLPGILMEAAGSRYDSFDDMRRNFVEMVSQVMPFANLAANARLQAENANWKLPDEAEVILAGWSSEHDRPEAFLLTNHAGTGVTPWELTPLAAGIVLPCDAALIEQFGAAGINLAGGSFDPERDGVRVMEAQRRHTFDGATFSVVGGYCQHTIVTREGIATRILRRWPDRIGEKIAA